MMHALTLWRPWSEAIVRGPKRIENRVYPPPPGVLGTVIAIHAGHFYEDLRESGWPVAHEWQPPAVGACPIGVVGVARVVAVMDPGLGAIRFALDIDARALLSSLDVRWKADDSFGWVLSDVRAFETAIPCRGYQRLWRLPPDVLETVVREIGGLA